jgi:hypothetical protein
VSCYDVPKSTATSDDYKVLAIEWWNTRPDPMREEVTNANDPPSKDPTATD